VLSPPADPAAEYQHRTFQFKFGFLYWPEANLSDLPGVFAEVAQRYAGNYCDQHYQNNSFE